MSVAELEVAIPAGDRILLDTTVLAAYLDAAEDAHPVAAHILDSFVAPGRNEAVVSMATVMEILVRPLRASPPAHSTVLQFLRHHPHLETVSLHLQMAQDAAFLRAEHRFAPPDALVIATGLACQVGHLVTNDHDWAPKLARLQGRIRVCTIDLFLPLS
jgi:predicted nucleic acid-binding protein